MGYDICAMMFLLVLLVVVVIASFFVRANILGGSDGPGAWTQALGLRGLTLELTGDPLLVVKGGKNTAALPSFIRKSGAFGRPKQKGRDVIVYDMVARGDYMSLRSWLRRNNEPAVVSVLVGGLEAMIDKCHGKGYTCMSGALDRVIVSADGRPVMVNFGGVMAVKKERAADGRESYASDKLRLMCVMLGVDPDKDIDGLSIVTPRNAAVVSSRRADFARQHDIHSPVPTHLLNVVTKILFDDGRARALVPIDVVIDMFAAMCG